MALRASVSLLSCALALREGPPVGGMLTTRSTCPGTQWVRVPRTAPRPQRSSPAHALGPPLTLRDPAPRPAPAHRARNQTPPNHARVSLPTSQPRKRAPNLRRAPDSTRARAARAARAPRAPRPRAHARLPLGQWAPPALLRRLSALRRRRAAGSRGPGLTSLGLRFPEFAFRLPPPASERLTPNRARPGPGPARPHPPAAARCLRRHVAERERDARTAGGEPAG